jgi:hypothetical protein
VGILERAAGQGRRHLAQTKSQSCRAEKAKDKTKFEAPALMIVA